MVSGCETHRRAPASLVTGSISDGRLIDTETLTTDGAQAAVQTWSSAYSRDEKHKLTALNYASALRAVGQTKQAVSVMRKAAIYHPKDRHVLAQLSKALADNGQFEEALETVHRAQRRDNPDWQLLATEGGILDSLGDHDAARSAYRQALVLAPDEPQILNNLGLSHVLTGDLIQAETFLRRATQQDKSSVRVRQNLALVLALQGRSEEANALAVQDLTREQADANFAYLTALASKPEG